VRELQLYADEVGLPTPERPKPLPAVRRDDINVICWMAVTPDSTPSVATPPPRPLVQTQENHHDA